MAEVIKILGQLAPSASTYGTLYTVPSSKSAVISSITICNTNATDKSVRVHIVASGGSEGFGNVLYYDLEVPRNETLCTTQGITLATGDFVRVWASATNVCFQIFGSEIG